MQNNKLLSFIIVLLFGLTILFSFASSIFFVIESTERAVIFRKFGGGLDKINIIQNPKTPNLYRWVVKGKTTIDPEEIINIIPGQQSIIIK